MLHENTIKNQVQPSSFNKFKLGLRSLIKTNDLEPERAQLLLKHYGKKLKEDQDLYNHLESSASIYVIMQALKLRAIGNHLTQKEIDTVLRKFEPMIKRMSRNYTNN